MADLPKACRTVLSAWEPADANAATVHVANGEMIIPNPKAERKPTIGEAVSYTLPIEMKIPLPKFRPKS